jgi:[ribosomal protein S5]-alanine N-acetyltransferase
LDGAEELEIDYSLMPSQQGKGYAIEAAKKCKEVAFENQLSPSIISIIHIHNEASAKVAINNGMLLDKSTLYNNSPVNVYRINLLKTSVRL